MNFFELQYQICKKKMIFNKFGFVVVLFIISFCVWLSFVLFCFSASLIFLGSSIFSISLCKVLQLFHFIVCVYGFFVSSIFRVCLISSWLVDSFIHQLFYVSLVFQLLHCLFAFSIISLCACFFVVHQFFHCVFGFSHLLHCALNFASIQLIKLF